MGCNLPFLHQFLSLVYPLSFMANSRCSIELEPRTLKQRQLDQVREVAVGIIQKKEPSNEESNIFIEGIKPVSAIKEMAVVVVQETNKLEKEEDYSKDEKTNNGIPPCQLCSCNSSSPLIDSPGQSIKEPLSAPF